MVLMNPVDHIENCHATSKTCVREEWVHQFIHTLYMIPRNWYTSIEIRQGTIECEEIASSFIDTFRFGDDNPPIDIAI